MPRHLGEKTVYGPNKYAALHLMLARWLRNFPVAAEYHYVTLGGTELRDIHTLDFIDRNLISPCQSFETNTSRHALAISSALMLRGKGLAVDVVRGDLFANFRRTVDKPHLFFFDFEGTCTAADYPNRFAQLLRDSAIREGDTLLITSYLGRNPGWSRLFKTFESEFIILEATDTPAKQFWYRRAHPTFTLYRGLSDADLQNELELKCIGCVEYRDSSTMGLYGYVVSGGVTSFANFVKQAPYFSVRTGDYVN